MNQGIRKILTEAERAEAGCRMALRHETRESVVTISQELNVSMKHLYSLERKREIDPEMKDLRRAGRPAKVNEALQRRIVRSIMEKPFATSTDLTNELNMGLPHEDQISARTFRRVALNKGLKACRPAFKPPITSKQAEARLDFLINI